MTPKELIDQINTALVDRKVSYYSLNFEEWLIISAYIKRLEGALEFYSKNTTYVYDIRFKHSDTYHFIIQDEGNKAREALASRDHNEG